MLLIPANQFAGRTITGTADQVVVANGDGVGGNPTLSLPQSIATTSAVRFGSLSIGSALQRGSLFEAKEATAAALTAGSAYAAISHAAAGLGLSILNTGFSTDLGNGLSFRQNGSGVGTIGVGLGSLLSSTTGLSLQFDYPNDTFSFYFGTAGSNGSVQFAISGAQTQVSATALINAAPTANYYNPVWLTRVTDGAGNSSVVGEWGSEGNWTQAGGFTLRRHYLWDHDASLGTGGRTLLYWDTANTSYFQVGGEDITLDLNVLKGKVIATGETFSAAADGSILGGSFGGTVTKNDTNARTFHGVSITPIFNTGASNTNTTFNILNIDSTNTAVTGLTVNPVLVKYGGTELLKLASTGVLTVDTNTLYVDAVNNRIGIGRAPDTIFHIDGQTASVNSTFDSYGTNGNFRSRRGNGDSTAITRAASGDNLGSFTWWGAAKDDTGTGATYVTAAAVMRVITKEAFTTTGRGTYFELQTAPLSGTVAASRLFVDERGLFLGSALAARATTEPTFALNLFDGVAPVGALTNGVSLHSASGKLKLVDAAGTAGWVLAGQAANAVSPTSPNRTITVEVNGTTYYLHAKTTND